MKHISALLTLLFCASLWAGVPVEVKELMHKDGVMSATLDGEQTRDHGIHCQVVMNPYGGESSISFDSNAYHNPVAHLDGARRYEKFGEVVYLTTSDGKRPGGSVCGDWDQLLKYNKLVRVKSNQVSIEEKYRCLFGGKTEYVVGCNIEQ